jgi:hypothetical protein
MYTGPAGTEVADPPVRLPEFLDSFTDRSAFTSICQRDLSAGLVQMGELIRKAIGSPCVDAMLADVKKSAGLQVDCVVEDLVGATSLEIKSCEADVSARPCWRLDVDPVTCTMYQNLKLVVQRDALPDPMVTTRMSCVLAPEP